MSPEAISAEQILEADWTWTGRRFEEGIQIAIAADGRIAAVGHAEGALGDAGPGVNQPRRLEGRALLPGFVNAHSHAFQRGLRGLGESYHRGMGDFWSWREAMYALVDRLDGEAFYELTLRAFQEMRDVGITTVGEFHYLHHSPAGDDFRFDELVLEAAQAAGIRITLLNAFYRTGAPGQPLTGAQRRFATPDLASYWTQMDHLAKRLSGPREQLGAVAHSLRAAGPDEVADLLAEARRRDLVLHLHAEEQPREIEEVTAAHGQGPLALLNQRFDRADRVTAVHCTHSRPADLERFAAQGGHVCLCPLTEANLGDGFADLPAMLAAGITPCLGSDSNARISMTEEMRWMEYAQRLARQRRGIARGEIGEVAPVLFDAATRAGAASLGVAAGALEPGLWADLALVDLAHPTLAAVPLHSEGKELAAALIFGAGDGAIEATAVAGRWRRTGE
jgi:formimidoylglutamate deiminase